MEVAAGPDYGPIRGAPPLGDCASGAIAEALGLVTGSCTEYFGHLGLF